MTREEQMKKIKEQLQPCHEVLVEALAHYFELRNLYHQYYDWLSQVGEMARQRQIPDKDLCDIGIVFRESAELFDELRKDVDGRHNLISKILAAQITKDLVMDEDAGDKIQGQLCSGTADVKMIGNMPDKNSKEYKDFCVETLKIPAETVEQGLVKVDWKGLTNYITALTQMGRSVPSWVTKTYPDYRMKYMVKKNGLLGKLPKKGAPVTETAFDALNAPEEPKTQSSEIPF